MKSEDFERLKAVCDKEGFELLNVDHEDNEKYYVIAKKKERVKVKFDGGNLQSRAFFFMYGKDAEHKMVDLGCFKVGEFLASQLEEYLNK